MLVTAFFGNVSKDYYKTGDTSKILKTSDGKFTNAVYTMSKTILNIIEKQKPTHIAVAWDVNRDELKRKQKYTEYKANREQTKPELSSQFGLMQEVLKEMGVAQFWLKGSEADDIIGTLAKSMESEIPVYILTKDQDALQLITEKTRVWLVTKKAKDMYKEKGLEAKKLGIPHNVYEYSPVTFEEEYGLKPIQMVDKKAIEGDSSDNIPGVKGVGKTATVPLLKEYKTLERIYEVIENENPEKLRLFFRDELGIKVSPIKKLLNNTELAFISKDLATIDTNMEEFKDIKLSDLKFILNREKTKRKFEELEFESLVKLFD